MDDYGGYRDGPAYIPQSSAILDDRIKKILDSLEVNILPVSQKRKATERQKAEARAALSAIRNESHRNQDSTKKSPYTRGTHKTSPNILDPNSQSSSRQPVKYYGQPVKYYGVRVSSERDGDYGLLVVDGDDLDVNGRATVHSVPASMSFSAGDRIKVRGRIVTYVSKG